MRHILTTVTLACLCAASPALATPAPARPPALLDHRTLKPGAVLQGDTVFSRAGLEPFTATVLAVMEDFLAPNEDLVLVKLGGPAVDKYGVVNGMSGSPVYLDGKLVGAVSYRFGTMPREPIAGVTPAESMMALLQHREKNPRKLTQAGPRLEGYGDAVPIETPLVCGGCSDETIAAFGPRLRELGFTPVRGSGGATGTRFPVFPGGPIAASFVDGDVSISALGTVTYVDGDRILAFGHQFEGMGDAEVMMGSAEVFGTIPSLANAHKVGRAGAVIGVWTEDRLVGIGGTLAQRARSVPFTMKLDRSEVLEAKRDLKFNVVDDTGLGAVMAQQAFHGALTNGTGHEDLGTIHLSGAVTLQDGRRVPLDDTFSSVPARTPTVSTALHVGEILESLWRNPFERVRMKQVDFVVKQDVEPHLGMMVRSGVDKVRIHAGETLRAHVEVRTHREGLKRLSVEIPTDPWMEPGVYSVLFADGDEATTFDRDAGLVPYPQSLDEVVNILTHRRRGDHLYVFLADRVKGARVAGQPMPELPPSMLAILNEGMEGPPAKKLARRALKVMSVDAGMMILGDAETTITVLAPRVR
ncbi:MAG: hypothetical protein HY904_01860 [Deltaproteobacteria bacterium]|nr:hypothetical protein [Deltaproteobacteria bacterium]